LNSLILYKRKPFIISFICVKHGVIGIYLNKDGVVVIGSHIFLFVGLLLPSILIYKNFVNKT